MPNADLRLNQITEKDTGKVFQLENATPTFDSVADLQSATWLTVGQSAHTLGYYEPGDGGGNDYEIVTAGTGTDDGGSFIDLAGSGLQAKGLFPGVVNIRQFGASPSLTDNQTNVQAAFNYSYGKRLFVPQGEYLFLGTVEAALGLTLSGIKGFSIFKFGAGKNLNNVPLLQSAINGPSRDVKDFYIEGMTFDGASLPPDRWLQNFNDKTTITNPEEDYFVNGGGIGNTGANYVADGNYIATSQSGTGGSALTLNNTTMPPTKATLVSADFPASRRLRIVSAGDDSSVTFTVVGTDYEGSSLSEDIVGTNTGTAEGKAWFKTVSSITPNTNTSSTVQAGIEEYDSGSAASAGRRNPKYQEVSYLLRLILCENSSVKNCTFRNHYGPAVEEAGGLNVTIEYNQFDTVGKNDGPFPAIWTQSFGTPGAGQSFYQDSENTVIRGNVAASLERSFVLFSPTKGGSVLENTVDGWGESCVFISNKLNYNGGKASVSGNKFQNGVITDIICQGVEANAVPDLHIYNNSVEKTQGSAFGVPGCSRTRVEGNILQDCVESYTIPYAPFSERYGFNIGLSPIAGESRDISDSSYIGIGTIDGIGCKGVVISKNYITETRAGYPSVFKQQKNAGDFLSKDCVISENVLTVPSAMSFLNTDVTDVWDAKMYLSIRDNVGHSSEAPVVIIEQELGGTTGIIDVLPGFRPRSVQVYAAPNNGLRGRFSVGSFSWTRDGVRNDFALRGDITDGSGQNIFIENNEVARIIDVSGAIIASLEFIEWLETGFRTNLVTNTETTNFRFVCYP